LSPAPDLPNHADCGPHRDKSEGTNDYTFGAVLSTASGLAVYASTPSLPPTGKTRFRPADPLPSGIDPHKTPQKGFHEDTSSTSSFPPFPGLTWRHVPEMAGLSILFLCAALNRKAAEFCCSTTSRIQAATGDRVPFRNCPFIRGMRLRCHEIPDRQTPRASRDRLDHLGETSVREAAPDTEAPDSAAAGESERRILYAVRNIPFTSCPP
jgi:hypothetical protein